MHLYGLVIFGKGVKSTFDRCCVLSEVLGDAGTRHIKGSCTLLALLFPLNSGVRDVGKAIIDF